MHVDMYDDRMEISSPGGMINGSRIQDLDLKHVPSMRRNEIISDIFGRLHYMERRGSGIRRILNSYIDYTEQPEFYSDEYFFIVTLPNRSEARSAQMELELVAENATMQQSSAKTQLSAGKMQQFSDKTQLSAEEKEAEEKEKEELKKWLECRAGKNFNKKTFKKLLVLLEKYGSEYYSNRITIANSFDITENAASRIIKKSVDCGIMRKEKMVCTILINNTDPRIQPLDRGFCIAAAESAVRRLLHLHTFAQSTANSSGLGGGDRTVCNLVFERMD